jgi:two-component system, sensor histidine kinase and response regulator
LRARGLTGLVVGLFGGVALLVAAILAALLLSVINLRDSDRTVRRSSDLLAQSYSDERSVVDLQTGLRGFLLTRQAAYLQPFTQAKAALPAGMAALRGMASDPTELRRINALVVSVNAYIARYANPLIATGARLSSAQDVQVTARGERLLDGLQAGFGFLNARILALSERQRQSANSAATEAILVAAVGLAVVILLLIAVGAYLLRRVLRPVRKVSDAAERMAAGELDVRVPEAGHGEVARLGRSFNDMASSIQHRDEELVGAQQQLAHAVAVAEDASEMKSNFLANMSHETRTPLNGVVGMLSLLSDTRLTPEQREYVDVAKNSSDALMTVVDDVLDIAKIEAGRLAIERRDFNLHDLVEASCDMVSASALSKGVELQSFVHDDVAWAVRGDRMRVGQILANLLSNAVKFTAKGEVIVEVSLIGQTDTTIRVRFEVRDTGIGIAPERIDHLYEPFIQAEEGTTREFGGTGLGLAISRELTSLMGGTMEAESEPGKGSTFRFEIPFAPAQARLPAPVPAVELHGLHVLVVDDNETNRRVFEAYVASWGMRPEVAAEALSALALLHRAAEKGDPFDVALLDLNMPGENGLDLARRIKASAGLRQTRVILLTSSLQPESDEQSSGISYHLTKPVRQSRLLDAISVAMAIEMHNGHGPAGEEPGLKRDRVAPLASARILVAEDQPVNWMLVERMLRRRGHSAANATDGRRVLEMLAADSYDLIFMDCHMPVLDGYDTTREIRRREATGAGEHVPIVAMTADAMQGDRERCLAVGMDDYMAKPISLDAVDEMLARWLAPDAHGQVDGTSSGGPPAEEALPASGPAGPDVLDRARMAELRTLFPGHEMSDMLRDLTAEVSAEIDQLDRALDDGDADGLASAAHRIKNSAHMIGAERLADAAAELVRRVRSGDSATGSSDRVALVREQWTATRAAIEAEVAQV